MIIWQRDMSNTLKKTIDPHPVLKYFLLCMLIMCIKPTSLVLQCFQLRGRVTCIQKIKLGIAHIWDEPLVHIYGGII